MPHKLAVPLLLIAVGVPTAALADQTLPRFYLMGGPFGAEFDSSVKLNGETLGTEISLEDDLKLDRDDTTFRMTGYWRFAQRHRLKFAYYSLERSNTVTLEKDIVIEDTVYPLNASVSAGWKVDTYQLAYSYSIIQGQAGEVGLTAGIHWPRADFYLRGEGAIVGGEAVEGEVVENADSDVPLPAFGVDGRYRLLDWLYLAGRAQYFGLKYDQYDGRFLDTEIGLEAWPLSWLGIGLGFVYTDFDFRVDEESWDGRLEYTTRGPHLYLAVEF